MILNFFWGGGGGGGGRVPNENNAITENQKASEYDQHICHLHSPQTNPLH